MADLKKLEKQAQACLAKKSGIPTSPLYNMARASKLDSKDDAKYIQDAVDYLACKAKAKQSFTDDEKEFMKELYEAFWWGGKYSGYKEAATLANNYVNGPGNGQAAPFIINPEIYRNSPIVIATVQAMKKFILEQKKANRSFQRIKCDNAQFRSRPYARALYRMNYRSEGKMKSDGVLEAAQDDQRLHKADGHFYLQSLSSVVTNGLIETIWFVESFYDFEPFESKNYYTNISLGSNVVKLPDGLSEYMTRIGVAKAFWYKAEWKEVWKGS